MKEILKTLCTDKGVSGCEDELLPVMTGLLGGIAEISTDNCGNIIASMGLENQDRHIMLDAHLDRIGLIAAYISDKGFIKAEPVGGVDLRSLPGSAVKVLAREEITGIICTTPPHLSDSEDLSRDKIWIDTGLPADKVRELVSPGDRIILYGKFTELLGNKISVPALDNRSGCAVLVRCAQLLAGEKLPCRVSFVFSSQEETNELGAGCAAFTLEPDEAVVIDVGFAAQEGVPPEKSGRIGCGGIISVSPVLSRKVTDKLRELAGRLGMEYSYEVCGGSTGTNADRIACTRGGIKTGVISIPAKNMHTQTEVVSLDDMERLSMLLKIYISEGGAFNA